MDTETKSTLTFGKHLAHPDKGEEICITGIAGRFPDSDDVDHFAHNLFNKGDLVSGDTRRWKPTHPEIPQRTGKINNIQHFDTSFFGINYRQAQTMDPANRIMLEKVYEAIIDSGYNPEELRGTRTGVYIGISMSETENTWFFHKLVRNHYAMIGNLRSMIPNRISFWLGLDGPSISLDTACSASMYAIEQAYRAIREGKCDQAIVGGCNLCLHPFLSLQFARLGVLSPDGACKSFDNLGNGYARSETVSALILQKAKNARRIYAEVLHMKTNCDGFKEQGITYPSGEMQKTLFQEFYQECGADPTTLTFMEAHGTGTKVGDPEEANSIDEVFCKNRTKPLLIGSVKSNIGHTEPASGMCSITKSIIAMETGYIPPNINYSTPREGVEGLEKGRMVVVTEKKKLPDDNGLIGVNSFGFGGANCHLLLRWNKKQKINQGLPRDDLPRLVCVSGRTEESVTFMLDELKSKPLDAELITLLHQSFRDDIKGHLYRGFSLLSKHHEIQRSTIFVANEKQPFTLIFGDFDLNWLQIAKKLLAIPLFSGIIQEIDDILLPERVTITEIISNEINPLASTDQPFIHLILQIAFSNLFRRIQLMPDYILGSAAELTSAYINGSLSLSEAIFIAFSIVQKFEIEASLLNRFKDKNNTSNKWRYIKNIDHIVDELASGSTILQIGKTTDYKQTQNQMLNKTHITVNLISNGNYDINHILSGLGHLYLSGINFEIKNIYPHVQWPVSRSTPMISPLLKWNCSENWYVTSYKTIAFKKSDECATIINSTKQDWAFAYNHVIDGRNLFPATGYLILAWQAFAVSVDMILPDMKVVFENIKFMRATTLSKTDSVEFTIKVQKGSGNFEVYENGVAVVKGRIFVSEAISEEFTYLPLPVSNAKNQILLGKKDIYKELRLRGYNYSGLFRSIYECNITETVGRVEWADNWIAFIDNLLQMQILQIDTRYLYVPTSIKRLTIDAKAHTEYIKNSCVDSLVPVYVYPDAGIIKSGAIEIRKIGANSIPRRKPNGELVLETYNFIPNETVLSKKHAIRVNMQIILENNYAIKVRAVELMDESVSKDSEPLSPTIRQALDEQPLIQAEIVIISTNPLEVPNEVVENKPLSQESNCSVVTGTNLMSRKKVLQEALGVLKPNGFILSRENIDSDPSAPNNIEMEILTVYTTPQEKLVLLRKTEDFKASKVIKISDEVENWLPQLQNAVKTSSNVIVYSDDPLSGILGLINCIRREVGSDRVKCVFITDDDAPPFNPNNEFYKNQLQKNLAINVLKDSKWGTYRHLLINELPTVEREHCYVNVTVRGDLSSLRWIEGPLTADSVLEPESCLIHIYCTALNFRDIMTASGRISNDVISMDRIKQDCVQGFEFAGRRSNGERVLGMLANRSLATLVLAEPYILLPIPDEWSMEDACTVPVVYGTVLGAFDLIGDLQQGKSILIHAGTGGIGQAAIRVSLFKGLKVFTTVGTAEKREFIKNLFPQLSDTQIGDSRSTSFEQQILKETDGKGVDYLLNSLAEEKLRASVRCLANGGKFIEIGKFDLVSDNDLQLKLFEKGCSFHGIMIDDFVEQGGIGMKNVADRLLKGIENGSVQPLTRTVFQSDEIEQAFRYMAAGKHTGKVIIKVREEENVKTILPTRRLFKGIPRYFCNPSSSHIIIGGLGGIGLELADWLVLRGAKKLILTSRYGVKTGYQEYRLRTWKSYGVVVEIVTFDITTKVGCEQVIEAAGKLGPVESIFNLAAVLRDALFENQTVDSYRNSLGPKAQATQYLDIVSRAICPQLKDFVIFSSVSCGRGNAGQTNYGMANSIMERICEQRQKDGYPALAIQWGAIGDVGLVADMHEEHIELEIGGTLQQRISSCLETLNLFLRQDCPIVGSMVVAEKRADFAADNVVDTVVQIMGLKNLKTVSLHVSLAELGMDSLMAVEIKQTLEREFEVFLTPQDIRNLTFARLQEIAELKEKEQNPETVNIVEHEEIPKGVQVLIRNVNKEDLPVLPLVLLPSLVEPDTPASTVFLLPGLEGMASLMKPLATNLTSHCNCLQYCYDNDYETIQEIAKSLLPSVLENLPKSTEFSLIAHSFGCSVAIELASLLEQEGRVGKLILLDGSPKMLMELAKQQLEIDNDAVFQTSLLCLLMSIFVPIEIIEQYRSELLNCTSFDQRIELALTTVPSNVSLSRQYLKKFSLGMYRRIKAAVSYSDSIIKLNSIVKLYKPTNPSVTVVADDYNLSELCSQPVDVFYFEGDHNTMLKNVELAHAINKFVEPEQMHFKNSIWTQDKKAVDSVSVM